MVVCALVAIETYVQTTCMQRSSLFIYDVSITSLQMSNCHVFFIVNNWKKKRYKIHTYFSVVAKFEIVQLYHGENKVHFDEVMMMSDLY
jgi:hypothetical protein